MAPEMSKWSLGENGVITCFNDGLLSWKHNSQPLPVNSELLNGNKVLLLKSLTPQNSGEYTCHKNDMNPGFEVKDGTDVTVVSKLTICPYTAVQYNNAFKHKFWLVKCDGKRICLEDRFQLQGVYERSSGREDPCLAPSREEHGIWSKT